MTSPCSTPKKSRAWPSISTWPRPKVSVNYSPAERIIAASGADIRFERGDRALYYYPPLDYIVFPLKIQFIQGQGGLPAYYAAFFTN